VAEHTILEWIKEIVKNVKWKQLLIGELSWKRLLKSVLFVYSGVGIYVFFYSDRLIFMPPPTSYSDTSEILKLTTSNGDRISAMYLPNPSATYTLLYAHGNAEDLGKILPILENIRSIGFSVFSYDYRGYGTSEGKPSEHNAYQDINAAYQYLTQNLDIPATHIIAYGRSVGGGSAIDLASHQPLAGLVVESSFVTAFRVMTRIPIFPFDKFANMAKIDRVNCPVLVMHGTADEVIPFWHGQQLFEAVQTPKQALWVENAGHNDLSDVAGDRYVKALQEFSKTLRSNS
jgi:abhydrolase domain-containing protein 17